LEKLQEHISY